MRLCPSLSFFFPSISSESPHRTQLLQNCAAANTSQGPSTTLYSVRRHVVGVQKQAQSCSFKALHWPIRKYQVQMSQRSFYPGCSPMPGDKLDVPKRDKRLRRKKKTEKLAQIPLRSALPYRDRHGDAFQAAFLFGGQDSECYLPVPTVSPLETDFSPLLSCGSGFRPSCLTLLDLILPSILTLLERTERSWR
jgi:hypothetical protein